MYKCVNGTLADRGSDGVASRLSCLFLVSELRQIGIYVCVVTENSAGDTADLPPAELRPVNDGSTKQFIYSLLCTTLAVCAWLFSAGRVSFQKTHKWQPLEK